MFQQQITFDHDSPRTMERGDLVVLQGDMLDGPSSPEAAVTVDGDPVWYSLERKDGRFRLSGI